MDLLLACRTDVGRVRKNNEDNFAQDKARGLFVVCDGMGGHNAGEVASKIASEAVSQHLTKAAHLRQAFARNRGFDELLALQAHMHEALLSANKQIYTQSQNNSEQRGMGTTCTAISLVDGHKGVLGHVGDSRLYLLRADVLFQLSCDHTYVHELVKRGAITPEQAEDHPQGNILSRAMGVQSEVPIQTWTFDIDPDDTFLLCSDGIYNYFPQNVGLAELMADTDLQRGLSAIIDTALERGGHDNCTGILLRTADSAPAQHTPIPVCIEHMQTWPLFAALTPLERLMVLGVGERLSFAAGTTLAEAGAVMDGLMLVVAGALQLRRGPQIVRVLHPGQAIGQHALLNPAAQPDALFSEVDTHVVRLSYRAFRHLARHDPEVGSKLLGSLMRYVGAVTHAESTADPRTL